MNDIKKELSFLTSGQLMDVCLRLSRYKRENKELLSYLLFHADNEIDFVQSIKGELDSLFEILPSGNLYVVKKSLRKVLRLTQKFIKFSGIKQTEVELLIHFCQNMRLAGYANTSNTLLTNLYEQQVLKINKAIEKLHEDLQFDYQRELEKL